MNLRTNSVESIGTHVSHVKHYQTTVKTDDY